MELILKFYEESKDNLDIKYQNCNLIIEPSKKMGGIYLGDFVAAKNVEYLKQNKISCVLTVADVKSFTLPKSIVPNHLIIPADDHQSFKLSKYFTTCFKFIHENRSKGKNVLVHCMAGISRSSTIIIGYLMTNENMSLEIAYKFVRQKRRAAFPNFGFMKQLQDYEEKLKIQEKKKI